MPELPSWSVRGSLIAAFFIIAALVYGASLHNQFVRLDDGLLIYENQAIQHINPQTIKTVFTTYDPELYIPLTLISYQVDYLLGGIDPFLYHLQNLFWHTLNALLVAWLAYLLIKKEWIALFVGVLFLVHPLHTEAVAWAAARKDVLSTFFFLASTITYLYYRSEERQKYYIASLTARTRRLPKWSTSSGSSWVTLRRTTSLRTANNFSAESTRFSFLS